jgi:SAM-dependent methyltransferase
MLCSLKTLLEGVLSHEPYTSRINHLNQLEGERTVDSPLTEHTRHYAPGTLDVAIEAALVALGKDDSILTITDLEGVDQFHSGGIEATRALAERAAITASDRVLDVGGGLGGPARVLAQEIGCHVTVVDLTEAYCRVGEKLTERASLADRVHFQQGNALDISFEDDSFDVVWTQHSSMNIADKARLYAQIHRALRPGGRLALHEVTAGSSDALHFPVPWAGSPATSFLQSQNAFRETVAKAGFRELEWIDTTEWTLAWFQDRQRAQQNAGAGANGLGLHLLLGPDAGAMARNFALNAQEGRIRVVQGVFESLSL